MKHIRNIMLAITSMAGIATLIYVLPAIAYGLVTVSFNNYLNTVSNPVYGVPMTFIALIGMIGAICYWGEQENG